MNTRNIDAETIQKRDSFNSKWGFIIACIGSAVGMGNIWMFPTRASLYGGGSFIIPYVIFVVIIGSTGVIGEMAFGRAMRSGPIGAAGGIMEKRYGAGGRKIGELLGLIPVIGSLAMAIGYTVVMGWILRYMVGTFTGSTTEFDTVEAYAGKFGAMATAFGNNGWQIAALAIGIGILMLGVAGGIEKANKILMPLFFALFVGLMIYTALQPGAADGYRYIFKLDPKELANPIVWVYGMGQAFFSLSIAGNGTLIYGSYLSEKEDVPDSARKVAFFDTLAALIAAMVIIPAMATTGAQLDQGGPGLLFIFLPNLFRGMPGGRVISVIFFVAVFFAGLSSLLNLFEAPIATLQEKMKLSRVTACSVIGIIGLVVSLVIQGIVSGWMDIVSVYGCPLGAGIMGIMFFWIGGKEFVEEEVGKGHGNKIGKWFYPLCKYVFCPMCFIVLIIGAAMGGIG